MDGRGPSRTARRTAMLRAAHHILDGEPKILADPFARAFAGFASDQELMSELDKILGMETIGSIHQK